MPDFHVVSFDRPWPPTYGGIVDVFWKLDSLEKLGVQLQLHYFDYGKQPSAAFPWNTVKEKGLERQMGWKSQLSIKPYIVYSRKTEELWKALNKDNAPILFEGQHCTGWLTELRRNWPNRALFVRCHNIEWVYYSKLAKASSGWKAMYFQLEATRLKLQEKDLSHATALFPISKNEVDWFKQYSENVDWIPPFFRDKEQLESGKLPNDVDSHFYLMQGNFNQVNQQNRINNFLLEFSDFEGILVVAGQGVEHLKIPERKNIKLISNPNEEVLTGLNKMAEAHILCGEHMGGVPLRLLHALVSGKPVWSNAELANGSGLESWTRIYSKASDILDPKFQPPKANMEDFWASYSNRESALLLLRKMGMQHE